jgi:DNA invertase Pin-like site-specific DNA recombinase
MPNTNGHGPKRAILYARVSTDEQARSGYSLAQQLEALRDYAAREGYEVLEEAVDPGESGASLERPGMDRVRDLVAAGGVSAVLAQDRDRFSREPAYLYLLREEFAAHGTRIKSLNDRGDDSPEGQLTDGILDQLAKFERAKTAERSRRGKKQKARLGKILSTRVAYGFDWNSARDGYVINLEQMAVLRRMFYMVGVEGRSLCAIQKELGEDGVPSPTGKAQWDIQSIRKLLKRDLYRPHTYAEMRELVAPDALARLEPDKNYGVYWFGERAETRKRVSENGESGRVYRHRYTSSVRPVADRVGVPVPDSGIPREWVDGARANLKNNRRPANAGKKALGSLCGYSALLRVRAGDVSAHREPRLLLLCLYSRTEQKASWLLRQEVSSRGRARRESVERGIGYPDGPREAPRRARRDDRARTCPDARRPRKGGCRSRQEAPRDQEPAVAVSGDGGVRAYRLRRAARTPCRDRRCTRRYPTGPRSHPEPGGASRAAGAKPPNLARGIRRSHARSAGRAAVRRTSQGIQDSALACESSAVW